MRIFKLAAGQSYLESASFGLLLILLFLLPIFISPVSLVSFLFAKVFLVVSFTVATFILLILYVLKKGSVTLPKNWWMLTILAVPVIVLISALLSSHRFTSLIGYGVELDTFFSILILFALLFLVSQVFTSARRIFYAQIVFLISILILFIFHGIRLIFGPEVLSFGSFPLVTSNTFGNWKDLAIFAGLVIIMGTLLIETTRATKQIKVAIYIIFALALAFLVIVNFFYVWLVLGVLSLISFVYLFSIGGKGERRIPILSIIILVVSILFLITGDQIVKVLNQILGVSFIDQGPLWGQTLEVVRGTFSNLKNILFGSGPNTFSLEWSLHKADAVNQTAIWNTDFNYGASYLATTLITTGILGVLAWLSFIIFFVYQGFKSLFTKNSTQNNFLRYLTVSSFVSALFLWLMLALTTPGIVVIVLTFFFTGLFLASLSVSEIIPQNEISFTRNPKIGFVITLALVFLLIITIDLGYISFQKTLSSIYYQKGLQHLNQDGNLIAAREQISKAISLAKHDIYYRSLVDINLFQFNQIVNNEDVNSASVTSRAQQVLGQAVSNAQAAIKVRPLAYKNYLVLGNVYTNVIALNVPGAVDGAKDAYRAASMYAPKNPSILLAMAKMEGRAGNIEGVRQNISKALELKNNYTEAVFTLAQIEISAGNVDQAIASVEVATLIEPNNPVLYFQLGLLYYSNKRYKEASVALEDAIQLVPDYANAKYFLGLTYYELKRQTDAINQFVDLEDTNPDNAEIKFILENLQNGREPFEEVQPPLDDEPQSREELPIEEGI